MGHIKRKLIDEQEKARLAGSDFDFSPGGINYYDKDDIPLITNTKKDSNPKDAVGIKKIPISTIPAEVLMEVGVGLLEGARKYGRHNYRTIGVRASVYYDAAMRHLMAWWEGEDDDPDSALNHITKALCTLIVLRDAMINEKWADDRPPKIDWPKHSKYINEILDGLFRKYPNAKEPYTEKEQ